MAWKLQPQYLSHTPLAEIDPVHKYYGIPNTYILYIYTYILFNKVIVGRFLDKRQAETSLSFSISKSVLTTRVLLIYLRIVCAVLLQRIFCLHLLYYCKSRHRMKQKEKTKCPSDKNRTERNGTERNMTEQSNIPLEKHVIQQPVLLCRFAGQEQAFWLLYLVYQECCRVFATEFLQRQKSYSVRRVQRSEKIKIVEFDMLNMWMKHIQL